MRFWKRREIVLPPTRENWDNAEPGTMLLASGGLLPPNQPYDQPARKRRR